jgi:HSP20 family protein
MVIRKKRDDDWDDDIFDSMFDDFGFDFERINERFRRMMERMLKESETNQVGQYGPFIYGFTYKIGPDGKPDFQEFGNVPTRQAIGSQSDSVAREPLTDINYDDQHVYVTFELPGVSKEDIDLKVSEENISINVQNPQRKYYKSIEMREAIKPETAKAKFSNGILDLTIDLARGKKDSGKSVKIE